MSFLLPEQQPTPALPKTPEAPPPVLAPQGVKGGRGGKKNPMQPSFLGSDALPSAGVNTSNKTLLGQ